MVKFPSEFSDLLNAQGRRILHGRQSTLAPGERFFGIDNAIDKKKAAACLALLEDKLRPALTALEAPIPETTITGMKKNYEEWLPKTVRVKTAYLERKKSRGYAVAAELGLAAMLQSQSFAAFASAIAQRPIAPRWGMQVLCYGPGDYAGPHNDHHPEEPKAIDGYLDVHLTLANTAVAEQTLVYARRGHFSESRRVATLGGITAYRLPFWHYTTPLVAKPHRASEARRWVLLGTFLYG